MIVPVQERILRRSHRTDEGCRIWEGAVNGDGYGIVRVSTRKHEPGGLALVHRWIYQWAVGKIRAGMTLDHVCHTLSLTCPGGLACEHRRCFEPSHLEQIHRVDNWQRAANRRREQRDQ